MTDRKNEFVYSGARKALGGVTGYFFEQLEVGMTAKKKVTVDQSMVELFAVVSGDNNPVHFDEAYAQKTHFKGCIVHGMVTSSFFSGFLSEFPGPGSVLTEISSFKFLKPVRVGDEVSLDMVIRELKPKGRSSGAVELAVYAAVKDELVLMGVVEVTVPRKYPLERKESSS